MKDQWHFVYNFFDCSFSIAVADRCCRPAEPQTEVESALPAVSLARNHPPRSLQQRPLRGSREYLPNAKPQDSCPQSEQAGQPPHAHTKESLWP